jgi:hypothetical protein
LQVLNFIVTEVTVGVIHIPAVALCALEGAELAIDGVEQTRQILLGRRLLEVVSGIGINLIELVPPSARGIVDRGLCKIDILGGRARGENCGQERRCDQRNRPVADGARQAMDHGGKTG